MLANVSELELPADPKWELSRARSVVAVGWCAGAGGTSRVEPCVGKERDLTRFTLGQGEIKAVGVASAGGGGVEEPGLGQRPLR